MPRGCISIVSAFSLLGAGAVAHLAAKSLVREARGGVDDGDAHAGVTDAGERRRERTRRAGLHAGDVLAHVAGDLLGNEEGRAAGSGIERPRQPERFVRTGRHALPAARTECEGSPCRRRRQECLGIQRALASRRLSEPQAKAVTKPAAESSQAFVRNSRRVVLALPVMRTPVRCRGQP